MLRQNYDRVPSTPGSHQKRVNLNLAMSMEGEEEGDPDGVESRVKKPPRLCFSKTSKCLSGWELYLFIILSSDAHFTHDTPGHYVLDLPFAR